MRTIDFKQNIRLMQLYFQSGNQRYPYLRKDPTYKIRFTQKLEFLPSELGAVHICATYEISNLGESDFVESDCSSVKRTL